MDEQREIPIWVIRAGQGGRDAGRFEAAGVAGLAFPPLPGLAEMSRSEASVTIAQGLGGSAPPSPPSGRHRTLSAMLLRFIHEVQIGDRVLTPDGASDDLLFGVVTGGYEVTGAPAVPGYYHIRKVSWLGRIPRLSLPERPRRSIGAPSPIFRPGAERLLADLPIWDR